jgi:hypothetical protein
VLKGATLLGDRPEAEGIAAEENTIQKESTSDDTMSLRYKEAVERVISHLPVKNGVVDIDSIWIETSLPYDLLRTLLRRNDLKLPDNVDRINMKSRVHQGERSGKGEKR